MLTRKSLVHSVTIAVVLGLALNANADKCEIDGEYNYKVLFNTVWRAEIKDSCLNSTSNCSWYLQFCNTVPVNPCGIGHACEVNSTGLSPVIVGSSPSLIADGPTRFVVRYEPVTNNKTKCQNKPIQMNVIFECDKTKSIVVGPGAELTKLEYSTPIVSPDGCENNITVPFNGACLPTPPPSGLSAGSVLLILFFVALLVYLVGGILINHNNGARGWEMVPHHQFWSELPALCVDGCVFFVKYITCQGGPVSGGLMGGGGGNRSYDNI
uniref:Autophagy-related protein 27 n=1 Tax=Amblyomma cajennense TaxID=34607 RepID=A0A023FRB5_AMBCJ